MQLKLDPKFKERVNARFARYDFQVGVLEDGPYKKPKRGARGFHGLDVLSRYAGIDIRQKTREDSGVNISDVSKANRDRLGFNYLTAPFKRRSSDIIKFANAFFNMVATTDKYPKASAMRRCENLIQAIVRNPILRGEYGTNSKLTTDIKGFNHYMIDTAQLFKAIKAIAKVTK